MNHRLLQIDKGRREFRDRVAAWAKRIKVEPAQVQIRKMSRKWASCSSKRRLSFAEGLLSKPMLFQDYVIVHELMHFSVPNHCRLFKSLMRAHLGEYERLEARMKQAANNNRMPRSAYSAAEPER